MTNVSTVDPLSLPSVALTDKSKLPTIPCVYLAIDSQGVVQYIGRSVNPRDRWRGHHRNEELSDIGGVRIAYLTVDRDLLCEVEKALIQWFNPPLNGSRASRANKEGRKTGYVPMQVPKDFHALLQDEAKRRGMNMTVLLRRYGRLMVETVKQQS
jgi:hypothetical protein